MRIPRPLRPGDRVALVCPSSPLPDGALERALAAVADLGLEGVVYPSCRRENRRGYLAAGDGRRAADLCAAFGDRSIRGVLCLRGGYGAGRILPLLDLRSVAAHPKVFAGFSDVTALHTAFNQCCGFVTFHAPMPGSSSYPRADEYTRDRFRAALFGGLTGPLPLPAGAELTALCGGTACAPLCGGNLSLLADSLGTPWEIEPAGKILFLEDVNEPLHRVDAMVTALRNAGKLASCAGFLLGAFTDCPPEDPDQVLSLGEIFYDLLPPGKPALMGLPCGHTIPTMSLPLGARLRMDAGRGTLEVLP